ncbi:hypothetical protein D3C85_1480060 [compost metagenome]
MELYLLHQGIVAVIDTGFGGEAVVTLGIDHQGADGLSSGIRHHYVGIAADRDGILDTIDGHRSDHSIVRPLIRCR